MPQPKSINLLVLCQPSTISVKHPAQNFLSIARKLDLRTQVLKPWRGGQEEEFARSLPYTLALHMRVCLEKRKACETDATPCVCLLSPFKSYIINFFHTENCIYPLGLESGEITDEALTHRKRKKKKKEKLIKKNFVFSFQIDFGSLRKVTRIATQGSAGSDFPFYVESFQLKYSNTSIDWLDYSEHGQPKVTINLLRV